MAVPSSTEILLPSIHVIASSATAILSIGPTSGGEQREDMDNGNV